MSAYVEALRAVLVEAAKNNGEGFALIAGCGALIKWVRSNEPAPSEFAVILYVLLSEGRLQELRDLSQTLRMEADLQAAVCASVAHVAQCSCVRCKKILGKVVERRDQLEGLAEVVQLAPDSVRAFLGQAARPPSRPN